ncbi:hypothetical protein G9A89_016509 [Geosiphon pyriformis]|nr:hypothetical protein G9A89_016509 [Geosiphon pyriformis]
MTSWQTTYTTSNTISVEVLRAQLSALGLDPRGHKSVLKKRLKHYLTHIQREPWQNNAYVSLIGDIEVEPVTPKVFKEYESTAQTSTLPVSDTPASSTQETEKDAKPITQFFTSSKPNPKPQPFDYYLCFDVEATCEEGGTFNYSHEIIEFPVLLIESNTFNIVDVFHSYVKPSVKPKLTEFCKKLTGIPQTTVDASPLFPEMLTEFQVFLHRYQLFYGKSCAFITDGPWDIRDFVRKQCKISGIPRPSYFSLPWVDLRALFAHFYNCEKFNIDGMLARYGLQFEGRPHSGIDDTRNIAIIAKRLWGDGALFLPNRTLAKVVDINAPPKLRKPK